MTFHYHRENPAEIHDEHCRLYVHVEQFKAVAAKATEEPSEHAPDWKKQFEELLPQHAPGCTCLLCEWRPYLLSFIENLVEEAREEAERGITNHFLAGGFSKQIRQEAIREVIDQIPELRIDDWYTGGDHENGPKILEILKQQLKEKYEIK